MSRERPKFNDGTDVPVCANCGGPAYGGCRSGNAYFCAGCIVGPDPSSQDKAAAEADEQPWPREMEQER